MSLCNTIRRLIRRLNIISIVHKQEMHVNQDEFGMFESNFYFFENL
jgi:hypothetical protein